MDRVRIDREWKVLGVVLDQFNALEQRIASIICAYVAPSPDRAKFVTDRLLHNSVLPFGAKVKLLLAIARDVKGPKKLKDPLHRMLHIRNALAHGHVMAGYRNNHNALLRPVGPYLVIESLTGDGSVEEKDRSAAVAEFAGLLEKVNVSLSDLEKRVAGRGSDA
jgi:hypothetical protein